MCGLAGIVAWDDRFHILPPTLDALSSRIAHRGPDGVGQLLSHDHEATALHPQAGLVHRRLAIIDLDPRSDQPFTDGSRRWVIFNGEIYNYRDLRAELEKLDPQYTWRTSGDTEVLLRAYAAWGERGVEHLNGMFAFAIWDEPTATLLLARDRLGQKPLYIAYAERGAEVSRGRPPQPGGAESMGAVAFASELPALLAIPWVGRTVANDALVEYLQWGYIPSPLTIFEGVWRLKPATTVAVTRTGAIERTYFDPNKPGADTESRDPVARTRELLTQAVRRQLVADVPIGCFLSGGIDSSIVTAAMKAAAGNVLTFSIGFDDPLYDESRHAAAVAAHLGTKHHAFTVRPEAAADLPRIASAFGEPFGDSSALPTYYLARETRQHVKVALSGDGGDELFGGYDRYRAMALGQRLRGLLTPIPWKVISPLSTFLPGTHPKSRLARAKRLLGPLPLPAHQRYSSYLRLMDDLLLRELLQPAVRDYFWLEWDRMATHFDAASLTAGRGPVEAALAVDRLYYLPDDLLAKVDRCSMQFALEVRSPFMDHDLVSFAAGLREPMLLKGGGKRLLREAFAPDLPAEVFTRPKMGFAVPIGQWMREGGELNTMLRDLLLAERSFAAANFERDALERLIDFHERGIEDHSQRLYALLMLELWYTAFQPQPAGG
jgi:asparagine synthase (glutamine-hydrolysing)